jgi:hypothetical protein
VSFLLSALRIASQFERELFTVHLWDLLLRVRVPVARVKLLQGSNKCRIFDLFRLCWIFVGERGQEARLQEGPFPMRRWPVLRKLEGYETTSSHRAGREERACRCRGSTLKGPTKRFIPLFDHIVVAADRVTA